MRVDTSSPGVSGHKCGLCLGLTTRDGLRQGHQGPRMPGLDVKAAEKQSAEQAAEGGQLNLFRRNK
jgi:hypothetical protein